MESLPGANKRQIYSSGLGHRTLTLTDAEASPNQQFTLNQPEKSLQMQRNEVV